ncbi:hypothetical protein DXG01_012066 [Tephrocybe rancida]|nr:hypothetical protein DXG01_012066 [Tephrocybe rancida]
MKFLDFEAHITVDGVEFLEYDVKYNEETKEVSCWVPSEAGKLLSITAKLLRRFTDDTCTDAYADGTFIDGNIYRKNQDGMSFTADSVRTSSTTIDIFAENAPYKINRDLSEQKAHERSKKAMVHKIRADCIAPPTPSTGGKRKASEEKDKEDEEHEAQLKALLIKINTLEARVAKKRPKANSKKSKRSIAPHSGEVIDLICDLSGSRYSDVQTATHDDNYLNSAGLKDLGSLVVKLLSIEITSETGTFSGAAQSDLTEKKVHERSKKAMAHKIRQVVLDILRADGIAPPAPAPPPEATSNKGKRKASEDEDDGNTRIAKKAPKSKKVKNEHRPTRRWTMKFLDFEAHITVDGVDLPEYDVKYDEKTNEATCWVPSEAGKPFGITTKPLRRFTTDICADGYADGIGVAGSIFYKNKDYTRTNTIWDAVRTSAVTKRPLLFAPIELTDNDDYLNSPDTKNLGNIVVKLSQIKLGSAHSHFSGSPDLAEKKVHERSKKAMVHKIRADGIAPPAPAPPPTTSKDAKRKLSEEMDEEDEQAPPEAADEGQDKAQLKALLEKINTLEAKIAKNGTKTTSKKKVKTEHRPVFVQGEVIDLT